MLFRSFVDGLLSPVGARDVSLRTGMDVWWDHRRWGTLDDPWAVVGSWPAPFTAPAPTVHAEEPIAAALEDAGARLSDDADSPWRVRVGSSDAIAAREPAWRAALDDPSAAGLTAWFSGGAVVALDATSGESTPVPGAGALVAAVPTDGFPENGVVMVVAGVDEQAAAAAAAALADDPGLVRAAYALVLDRDGTPLRAGGRVGG